MSARKRGQAIVEMALVLPIFIFLLIGIFDFGRALHAWSNMNYQCMQAARAATKRINPLIARNLITPTTHPSLTEVQAAFWNYKSPMTPQDQFSNVVFNGVGTSDATVEISASYNLTLFTPLVGGLVGGSGSGNGSLTISAVARENKE